MRHKDPWSPPLCVATCSSALALGLGPRSRRAVSSQRDKLWTADVPPPLLLLSCRCAPDSRPPEGTPSAPLTSHTPTCHNPNQSLLGPSESKAEYIQSSCPPSC